MGQGLRQRGSDGDGRAHTCQEFGARFFSFHGCNVARLVCAGRGECPGLGRRSGLVGQAEVFHQPSGHDFAIAHRRQAVRSVTLLFLFHDQPRRQVDPACSGLLLGTDRAGDRQGRFSEGQRSDQGSHSRVHGQAAVRLHLDVLAGGQRFLGLSQGGFGSLGWPTCERVFEQLW
jgi:hypothetical protein